MVDINVLEERIKNLDEKVDTGFADVKKSFADLSKEIKQEYVHKSEFDPIRRLIYGFVSVILLSVVGALVGLVVRASGQ